MFQKPWIAKVLLFLLLTSCYEELDFYHPPEYYPFIAFDGVYAGIDKGRKWVLLSIDPDYMNSEMKINTNLHELKVNNIDYQNGAMIDLTHTDANDSLPISFYTVSGEFFDGYLHFTSLPVVQIFCDVMIPDNSKAISNFILSSNSNGVPYTIIKYAGIEIRGRSASTRPKQSFGIELLKDATGNGKVNEPLLGMRDDDDWILDAMYIDKARMRNKVSMDLWRDICASSDNPVMQGKPYTESRYVEMFLNMNYLGLYNLTERFDRKQLDLVRFDGSLRGLLYKTEVWTPTTKFFSLADTSFSKYWDGWEQKYPDPLDMIHWKPVYDFTGFVISNSGTDFEENIDHYLDIRNVIDYYLFINICTAYDNMGTNMFYARYDRDYPFIIYPWDLDATWGRNWDSTFLNPWFSLTNICFNKIFSPENSNNFEQLKERWSFLRNSVVSHQDLFSRFNENYELLSSSGAIRREQKIWPEMNLHLKAEMEYIDQWIGQRIAYLDNQIYYVPFSEWDMVQPGP